MRTSGDDNFTDRILAVMMSSLSHSDSVMCQLPALGEDGHTQEDDMNARRLELAQTLLPRLDIPIVRIVDHHLPSLDREEVPNLILELRLYPLPQRIRLFRSCS